MTADDWQTWRSLRLRALGEAPQAFSARLTDWQGEADVEQRWRDRLTEVPWNLVAEIDGTPLGMASLTAVHDGQAEIISMWVDPVARGHGLATALLTALADAGWRAGALRVVLRVKTDNRSADALYRRHGFRDAVVAGRPVIEDGERLMELLPSAP